MKMPTTVSLNAVRLQTFKHLGGSPDLVVMGGEVVSSNPSYGILDGSLCTFVCYENCSDV